MVSTDERKEQVLREMIEAEGGLEQFAKNREQFKRDSRKLSRLLLKIEGTGRKRWLAVFRGKVVGWTSKNKDVLIKCLRKRGIDPAHVAMGLADPERKPRILILRAAA